MRRSILARGPLSWICSWPRSSSAMRASSVSAMLHTIPVTRQSSFNDPDDWKGCLSWRMLTNTSTCDTTKCKTWREINSLILHQEMKRQSTSTTSFTLRGKKWKTIFYASCCNFDAKLSCVWCIPAMQSVSWWRSNCTVWNFLQSKAYRLDVAYKMLDALRREVNKLFLGDAIQKIAL